MMPSFCGLTCFKQGRSSTKNSHIPRTFLEAATYARPVGRDMAFWLPVTATSTPQSSMRKSNAPIEDTPSTWHWQEHELVRMSVCICMKLFIVILHVRVDECCRVSQGTHQQQCWVVSRSHGVAAAFDIGRHPCSGLVVHDTDLQRQDVTTSLEFGLRLPNKLC